MKIGFKKILRLATVFSFIVLATTQIACSNPFASEEEEQGTFTISVGSNNVKANNSRAAAYPPNIAGSNPGNPAIKDLKFVVKFTPLKNGTAKTFTATGSSEFKGNIDIGHYKVTMDIYTVSDNLIYARGVAEYNPVEIKAKGNFVYVDAYDARNTNPPVISEQPQDNAYHVGATAKEMIVVADPPDDGGTLKYQWYKNTTDSNSGGTMISGATSKSYMPPTGTEGTTYYYVMITNDKEESPASTSIPSKAVRVYVGNNAEPPKINTQPVGDIVT